MFRGWTANVCQANDRTSKRRERRCLPTLNGSAACLEDRVLLSGASAAEVAKTASRLENTHAGKVVTADFESVLGTAPTGAQLVSWVHKLRGGVSARVLTKDLTATTQVNAARAAAANVNVTAIAINSDPPASTPVAMSALVVTASSTGGTASSAEVAVPSSGSAFSALLNTMPVATDLARVGLDVKQSYGALRAGEVSSSSSSGGGTNSTGSSSAGSSSELQSLLSSLGLTTSSPSELQSLLSSLSGSMASGSSPLQSLLTTGTIPTAGLQTTGTITSILGNLGYSDLGLSQLGLSQLGLTTPLSNSPTSPDAPQNGLTVAPETGLTVAPETGLTIAPETGLTIAPTSNLI
jgi:hypothetical protein